MYTGEWERLTEKSENGKPWGSRKKETTLTLDFLGLSLISMKLGLWVLLLAQSLSSLSF